jgi:hypothetical protein
MSESTWPSERSGEGGLRQQTELVYCTVHGCQVAVTFEVRGRFLKKSGRVVHCPMMCDSNQSCGQCCLYRAR